MTQPASEARRYFLGITGTQSGPYSEEDVRSKIRQRMVPPDALIWYEGLSDWQPILSIEYFRGAFEEQGDPPTSPGFMRPDLVAAASQAGALPNDEEYNQADVTATNVTVPPPAPAEEPAGDATSKLPARQAPGSFAKGGKDFRPVFKNDSDDVGGGSSFLQDHLKTIIIVLIVGLCGAGGYMAYSAYSRGVSDEPKAKPVTKLPPANIPAEATSERGLAVGKALSELRIHPLESIKALNDLIAANATDKAGEEAVNGLVAYYKETQHAQDAARVLVSAKRPGEALKLFLVEPPSYTEAEKAAFAAYEGAKDTARRDFLLEDIRILVGPLANYPLAVERLKLLEKEFPGQPHPYGFYLKSTEDKISDLFSRISFYYVQHLLNYISSELPNVTLLKRPLVEIKRSKEGKFRVVASYRGEIHLNQEKMSDIYFVFWESGDQWVIADTNLTPERKRFAAKERERHASEEMTADAMLDRLQGIFRHQFPKAHYHETVSEADQAGHTPNIEK